MGVFGRLYSHLTSLFYRISMCTCTKTTILIWARESSHQDAREETSYLEVKYLSFGVELY